MSTSNNSDYDSEENATPAKRPAGSGRPKKVVVRTEDLRNLAEEFKVETVKLEKRRKELEVLEDEHEELVFEIKHLKKKKEAADKQTKAIDRVAAEADNEEFECRIKKVQAEFMELIEIQKERIKELNTILRKNDKIDVAVDTVELVPYKTQLAHKELAKTLQKINSVLTKKVDAKNKAKAAAKAKVLAKKKVAGKGKKGPKE